MSLGRFVLSSIGPELGDWLPPVTAIDETTKSTKPTIPRRKAHNGIRGSVRKAAGWIPVAPFPFGLPCARRRGGFRPHPSPKVLGAGFVDFVGVVGFVERPGQGWRRRDPLPNSTNNNC